MFDLHKRIIQLFCFLLISISLFSCYSAQQSDLEGVWIACYQETNQSAELKTQMAIFQFMADSTFTVKQYISKEYMPIDSGMFSLLGRNLRLSSKLDTSVYHVASFGEGRAEVFGKSSDKISAYSFKKMGGGTSATSLSGTAWELEFYGTKSIMDFKNDSMLTTVVKGVEATDYWLIDKYKGYEVLMTSYMGKNLTYLIEEAGDSVLYIRVPDVRLSPARLMLMSDKAHSIKKYSITFL